MTARLRETLSRLASFLTRRARARDEEVADELRFHRDMLEADLRKRGLDPAEAQRQAALALGAPTQTLERYADQRSLPVLESLLQDTRYAIRTFGRAPLFTLAALLTLAIGIGGTTAIFSVVNAVLLRPLPYPAGDQLVVFTADGRGATTGWETFADLRDRNRAFDQLAAVRSWQTTLVTTEAERLSGIRVSANYFSLLGVQPALGRTFRPEEDHPERYRVILLSDGLWRRRFNADPTVVGRRIEMNDQSFEIIGVMPPGFDDLVAAQFYQPAEIWAPLGYDASLAYACRTCRHIRMVGRLKAGVTLAQAGDDITGMLAELQREYPTQYARETQQPQRLADALSAGAREPLLVLMAAVGFVLLIACANVANLLLARGMNRTREMMVRAALGAGRRRLVRQLVTESCLLWCAGGVAGLAVGQLLTDALVAAGPVDLPRADTVGMDVGVLVFSAGVAIATGLLFGLLPALSVTRGASLHTASRGTAGGGGRARHALVVVNLAVALVLLVGAGLMLRSVAGLLAVSPGFNPSGVITAQFSLIGRAYGDNAAVYAFIQGLVERVRALPGVDAAAIAGQIPMGGNRDGFGIYIEGLVPANPAEAPSAERYSVTPEYFEVMRIPLLRGRLIEPSDTPESAPVMLVSETAARTLFEGQDPIGRRVRVGGDPDAPWRTIVGIVGDVSHVEVTERPRPQMYLPQAQFTDSFLVLTARVSTDDPAALVPGIRQALREMDPAVALHTVATLESLLARSTASRRFVMWLLAGFAGVSLLLAAIGLYGVIAYTVASRTREVGVRIALGATKAHVFRLVLGSGVGTVTIGLLGGLAAATLLTRFLEGQLYGVEPLDPVALVGAVGVLGLVAAAAHIVPIRRALRVDPTIALRDE